MVYIILQLNGYKQLQRLQPEFIEELEKTLTTLVEIRGGRRRPEESGSLLYRFDDAGEAAEILNAAFALRDQLEKAEEELRGFVLLAEYFPDSNSADTAVRDLRGLVFNRETDESLLLGPGAAELFRPYCDIEASGGCFRAREKARVPRPDLGKLRDFCYRPAVAESLEAELSRRLDCLAPPDVFLIHGGAFSGVDFLLDAVLRKLSGGVPVFRVYPLRPEAAFPGLDVPNIDELPAYLSAAEKEAWRSHRAFLAYMREEEAGAELLPDFPAEEALAAFLAVMSAHLRRCEENLSPAVVVCRDVHLLSPSAGRLLARLLGENLQGWRLLPVCTSLHAALGNEFRGLPCASFRVPPVGAEEFKALLRRLPAGSFALEGLSGIFKRAKGRVVSLYYELSAGTETDGEIPDEEKLAAEIPYWEEIRPVARLLLKQERALREVLYVLEETAGLLSSRRCEDLLERAGLNRAQVREITRRLEDLDLPGGASLLPFLRRDPSIRRELIDGETESFLYELRANGTIRQDELLLRYFIDKGLFRRALEIFRLLAAGTLDAGDLDKADALIREGLSFIPEEDGELVDWKRTVLLTAKLRLALARDNADGMVETYSRLEDLPTQRPRYRHQGDCLLQKAVYCLKLRDVQGSLGFAKSAAMFFQDTSDSEGSARANGIIGMAMLAADNPADGRDYFRIARETAGDEYPMERLRNTLSEGITLFILGNYSRVLETCAAAAEQADALYARRWAMTARFILARTHFELGDYEEARKILEFLLADRRSLGYRAADPVLYSWLGRCLAYLGDPGAGLGLLNSAAYPPEALFFGAEADYFRGDLEKARDKLEQFLRLPYEGDCFLGDAFFWKDGFFFLENLSVGRTRGSEVLPRLVKSFHAYIKGLSSETGIEAMSLLIREEKNPKNDPYNMLYYYWYSRILPEKQDTAFEDKLTVLGRAVRNLQARTSRIDETVHKNGFLKKNYWNRCLMEDARRHNLV